MCVGGGLDEQIDVFTAVIPLRGCDLSPSVLQAQTRRPPTLSIFRRDSMCVCVCVCVCVYRFCFTVIPLRGCDIIKIPSTQKHKEHKIWFDSTVLCSYHVIIKKKEEAPKNNVSAEKSSNADKVAILNRVKILPNACILRQHLKHKHGSTNALHRPHGLRTTTKVNSC